MKKLFISLLNIFLLVSCGGGGGGGDAKMIADVAQAVAPVISSASSYSVQENQTSIGTALATASNYSSALSYSLSGADADAISINSSKDCADITIRSNIFSEAKRLDCRPTMKS